MVKKKLIKSLKEAKVEKDRRWIYNLIAWALEHQADDYTTFQRRIQSSIHYTKGKYEEYWNNPKTFRQHKRAQEICKGNNEVKYYKMSQKWHKELKIAHKLFKSGRLSKKSMKIIEKEITK